MVKRSPKKKSKSPKRYVGAGEYTKRDYIRDNFDIAKTRLYETYRRKITDKEILDHLESLWNQSQGIKSSEYSFGDYARENWDDATTRLLERYRRPVTDQEVVKYLSQSWNKKLF